MAEQQLVTETTEKSSRELVFEEIYRLKLEKHALELEEKGYTVVPDAIDMDMVKNLREIIICQSADKSNVEKPNIETWDGGNLREGMAPASGLERELQQLLDKLEGKE